jgi:hypothetical protein
MAQNTLLWTGAAPEPAREGAPALTTHWSRPRYRGCCPKYLSLGGPARCWRTQRVLLRPYDMQIGCGRRRTRATPGRYLQWRLLNELGLPRRSVCGDRQPHHAQVDKPLRRSNRCMAVGAKKYDVPLPHSLLARATFHLEHWLLSSPSSREMAQLRRYSCVKT